jgi:hypothetical protein
VKTIAAAAHPVILKQTGLQQAGERTPMTRKLVLVALSFLMLNIPATAGVIFDNYPINGGITAWTINNGFAVSDSFTLASGATANGVNFGVWLFPQDTITGVGWSIGTSEYGTNYGSGTASVSLGSTSINGFGYEVGAASFALPNIALGAGTYYLTLQNAVVPNGDPVYWDENDGPGIDVWENAVGHLSGNCAASGGGSGTCAESFQILGEASTTIPEPATCALLGSGLLAAACLRRRFFRS